MLFCAGLGTRLRPLTNNKPKALVEVNGKPLLQWNIEKLIKAGISELIINLHHFDTLIKDFLQSNDNFGLKIHFSDETKQLLDTGGGLKKASRFFGDGPFLVHNVDILSNIDLNEMLSFHQKNDALATLAVRSRKTSRYLMFEDNSNQLTGWTNIKTNEIKIARISSELVTNFAFSGIHIIDPNLFKFLPEDEVFSIIDAYLEIAKSNKILCYADEDSYWLDVGKPENIEIASKLLNKNKI